MNSGHTLHHDDCAIIHQALKALQGVVPLKYETKPVQKDEGYDYLMRGKLHGQKLLWCVQAQKRLTKAAELQALIQKDQVPHALLLVTRHVNNEAAERLQGGGIQFLDTAGPFRQGKIR